MTRRTRLTPLVVGAALVLGAALAGPGAAATATRFASPDGSASPSECTAMASPCTLLVALGAAQAGDTLSLAGGTYNLGRVTLPPVPLHWVPTDPRTRPILTSPLTAPTLDLTAAQSGTSLQGLEVDNTNPGQFSNPQSFPPALRVGSGVAATVRSSVLTSRTRCVEAFASGPLTIEDSTLSTGSASFCALLDSQSTLRRSTVERSAGELPASPPPVVVTEGLVEDSEVDGGLWLDAPTAVARRVRAIGATAIFGEGLVADSLARGFASDGAAIAADGDAGGTLRVVNSTAVSTGGPALLSRPVESGMPVIPNDLVVTNSIARGKGADIQATSSNDSPDCLNDEAIRCAIGLIHVDHSEFGTRAPLVTAPDAGVISEGAGNIAGDPLFADAANGDFHLRAGSPAIDAGTALDLALPTDLDGSARVQGGAPDLGALESAAPAGPPTVTGAGAGADAVGSAAGAAAAAGTGRGPDRTAPVLGPVRVSPARFRVAATPAGTARGHGPHGTTVTTTLSEGAVVSIAVQREAIGRRRGRACVAPTGAPGHAARCTRWTAAGPALSRRVATAGSVTFPFSGRLGTHRLAPGRYRFAVSATDAVGNASATGFAGFTVAA